MVGALRAAARPGLDEAEQHDVLAFAALALEKLQQSVEATAGAWERRGYWVKADRFRMEWDWLGPAHQELDDCLARRDWSGAWTAAGKFTGNLGGLEPKRGKAPERPWAGAWDAWRARELHRRNK